MRLDIRTRTPSLNAWQRMNRWKRRGVKRRLEVCLMVALVRQRPIKETQKRRVIITRHSPRALDYDNLVGGCKPLIDALVDRGLLVDDSPSWLVAEYRQAKSQEYLTEVEIMEVEE